MIVGDGVAGWCALRMRLALIVFLFLVAERGADGSGHDCHRVCTSLRHSLDPHQPCRQAKRQRDRSVGKACNFGFSNGFDTICHAMCEGETENLFNEMSDPAAVCSQWGGPPNPKASIACRAGE